MNTEILFPDEADIPAQPKNDSDFNPNSQIRILSDATVLSDAESILDEYKEDYKRLAE